MEPIFEVITKVCVVAIILGQDFIRKDNSPRKFYENESRCFLLIKDYSNFKLEMTAVDCTFY